MNRLEQKDYLKDDLLKPVNKPAIATFEKFNLTDEDLMNVDSIYGSVIGFTAIRKALLLKIFGDDYKKIHLTTDEKEYLSNLGKKKLETVSKIFLSDVKGSMPGRSAEVEHYLDRDFQPSFNVFFNTSSFLVGKSDEEFAGFAKYLVLAYELFKEAVESLSDVDKLPTNNKAVPVEDSIILQIARKMIVEKRGMADVEVFKTILGALRHYENGMSKFDDIVDKIEFEKETKERAKKSKEQKTKDLSVK